MNLTLDCADIIVIMLFALLFAAIYMLVKKIVNQIFDLINLRITINSVGKIYNKFIDDIGGTGTSQTMKKVFSASLKALVMEFDDSETSTDSEK